MQQSITTLTFPMFGESVTTAQVTNWYVSPGDIVEKDQEIALTESFKAKLPLTAKFRAKIVKLLVPEKKDVPVDTPLVEVQATTETPNITKTTQSDTKVSESITNGPVQTVSTAQSAQKTTMTSVYKVPPYNPYPGDEVVPFSRSRKILAEIRANTEQTVPHVVTLAEIDWYNAIVFRDKKQKELKSSGIELDNTVLLASAVVRALRENPVMNSTVIDGAYVIHKSIHLGIALDTPQGPLVPVIQNIERFTLEGIARAVSDLQTRAKKQQLTPDDLTAGTFTINAPLPHENFVGSSLIPVGNVGVLTPAALRKRVVATEVNGEDRLVIHPVMFASLAYDHRVVDGVAANSFLFRVTEILEKVQFD